MRTDVLCSVQIDVDERFASLNACKIAYKIVIVIPSGIYGKKVYTLSGGLYSEHGQEILSYP
jgi:hypothetical protein